MASPNCEPPHIPYCPTHVPDIANVFLIGRDVPAQGIQTKPMSFTDVSPHFHNSCSTHLPSGTNVALTGRDTHAKGIQTRPMSFIDVSHLRHYHTTDAPVSANSVLMANAHAPALGAQTIDSPAYRRYHPTHAPISANSALSARDAPMEVPQNGWFDSPNSCDHYHPTNGTFSTNGALSVRDATMAIHSYNIQSSPVLTTESLLPDILTSELPYSLHPMRDFAIQFTDSDEEFNRVLKEWCTDAIFEVKEVVSD